MPLAEESNAFADLIGGENGAPAYQVASGRFAAVPKAEPVTPLELGAFSDLLPGSQMDAGVRTAGADDEALGVFASMVPKSPTSETEKALAESAAATKPEDESWVAKFQKGVDAIGNISGAPVSLHAANDMMRRLGTSAGRYIFNGLRAFERGRAQYLRNPTPEAYEVQPDALFLPDGSRLSPAEQDELENKYRAELASHAPEADANAAELKTRMESAERNTPVDPKLDNTIPARLAEAAGPTTVMVGESMIPGAGMPLMAMHGALATEQEALDAGSAPEQARRMALRSAVGLAIFGGTSKLAAVGVAKLLPQGVKPLTQFIAQFVGQEAANETSTRAIAAWNAGMDAPEGEKIQRAVEAATDTTLESTTFNTLFALMGAAKAAGGPSRTDGKGKAEDGRPEAETPVKPASEPVAEPAAMSGSAGETVRYVEPAREAVAVQPATRSGESVALSSPTDLAVERRSTVEPSVSHPISETQSDSPLNPSDAIRLQSMSQEDRSGATKGFDSQPEPTTSEPNAASRISPERELLSKLGGTELKQPSIAERATESVKDASKALQDVVTESRKQGLVAPGSTGVQGGIEHLGKIWRQIRDLPKYGDFKKAILGFGQRMQSSFLEAKEVQRTIKKAVPRKADREGMMAYIEAGGDRATLTTWRDASPERDLRRGYEAALNLTGEQIEIADHLRDFYSAKLAEGQQAGILAEGRENYVNRIVDKRRSKGFAPVTAGGSGVGPGTSGRLSKNFKHGLHRVFENSFDAERNGIRYKTKDVAELAPIYLNEMNKTIGTRQLLADLAHGTAEDGRALAFPKGSMATMTGKEGETTAHLIKPNTQQMVLDEITGQDVSSHDYSTVEHPALNDWKWVGTDNDGKPILVKGNLALHPEIAGHVKNLLGESALRRWYNSDGSPLASLPKALLRSLDKSQQLAKSLLFSSSGFHHANLGFHAVEHRVNPLPPFFKSLSREYTVDPQNPVVIDGMRHGLQLAPDQLSASHFMEGFMGPAVDKIPLYGRLARAVSDHLFERFVPALKLRLYDAMLGRNMKLYAAELARNEVTPDQVKYLSATQSNAALSHLNYIDIGRSPTVRHIISLGTLAPDFTESRGRFLLQAAKTLTGSKAGVEQFTALAFGGALIAAMAAVTSKALGTDWDARDPFGVTYEGRRYGIRSVQGDVAHLITNQRSFFSGRVSPIVRLLDEAFWHGTNYRGEKIDRTEAFKDYFANYVPISLKNVPGLRDLFETTKNNPVTPWESFMGAMGIQASRYSPITKTYQAARAWEKAAGIPEDKGSYPVSKYQQLRYSLEDGDMDRARAEYQKLIGGGEKRAKISEGFRESILHPFTGSQASDRKFRASLPPEDRTMYDLAVRKRHDILRRYQAMRAGR